MIDFWVRAVLLWVLKTFLSEKWNQVLWFVHFRVLYLQDLLDGINYEGPTVEDMTKLETFICRLYKYRAASSLNTVCVKTFLTCNKPEDMPPTSNSAKVHILRALSQAFIWINAHIPFLEEESTALILRGQASANSDWSTSSQWQSHYTCLMQLQEQNLCMPQGSHQVLYFVSCSRQIWHSMYKCYSWVELVELLGISAPMSHRFSQIFSKLTVRSLRFWHSFFETFR